jgi:hypothetical protein
MPLSPDIPHAPVPILVENSEIENSKNETEIVQSRCSDQQIWTKIRSKTEERESPIRLDIWTDLRNDGVQFSPLNHKAHFLR